MTTMQTTEPATLTRDEADELADHELIIDQSQALFIEVGNSLMAIRDSRLYRATHPTFEAYLAARWPAISKRRGYQLIDAAAIAKTIPIQNERQARALKGVPIEQAKQAYQQASVATNGQPTAKSIEQAVDDLNLPADYPAYQAKAASIGLRLNKYTGEYMVHGHDDGPRISMQWSVIKSFLDASAKTYELQAQALATVAPEPAPIAQPSQELIAARRYQSKLASGMHNLEQAKDRQQVRTLCADLLDCLDTLDGLPSVFEKAIEAVLTMAADLLSGSDYQALAARLEGVVTQ